MPEAQDVWDECLLNGWYHDQLFGHVVRRFFTETGEENFDRFYALDRTPAKVPGGGVTVWSQVPVRAVFRENWPQLNDLLWDGMISSEAALKRLKKRVWRRTHHSSVATKRSKASSGRLVVSVRERDRRHDWATVK